MSTFEDAADPGRLFSKEPRTESRTQSSTMFHTTAGHLTSRAPFRWREGQVAIFEAWIRLKGANALTADLTPLLRALDLDGYEGVRNYEGACVHLLILEKVRRKLSRTKAMMASCPKAPEKVAIHEHESKEAAEVVTENEKEKEKEKEREELEKTRRDMEKKARRYRTRGFIFETAPPDNPTGPQEGNPPPPPPPAPLKPQNDTVHQPAPDDPVKPSIKTEPKATFQWHRNLNPNLVFGSMPPRHLPNNHYEANPSSTWRADIPAYEAFIQGPYAVWGDRLGFAYPGYSPPARRQAAAPAPAPPLERKQEQAQVQATVRGPAPVPVPAQKQKQTKVQTKEQAPAPTLAPAPALAPAPQQEPASAPTPTHNQPTPRPLHSSYTYAPIMPPSLVLNQRLPSLMKQLQRLMTEFSLELRHLPKGTEAVALETAAYDAELELDHLGNILNEYLETSS